MSDEKVRTLITADAGQAMREFGAFSTAASRSIGSVQGVARSLHAEILGLAGVLAGSAFVLGIKNQIDLQDATRKSAQAAGMSVQAFDEMRYAAKLADVDSEVLSKTIAKLSINLAKAAGGDKDLKKLFEETLHVSVRGAGGAIRETDKVLEDIAGRFEQMEDGAKKVALAAEIFGEKLGPRIIPFLNQGKQGIQDLREEMRKLSGVMTDEQAASAEKFNDNMTRAGVAAQALQRTIANAALPTLVEFSDFFVEAAKNAGNLTAAWLTLGKAVARATGLDEIGQARSRLDALKTTAALATRNLAEVQTRLAANPNSGTLSEVADKLRAKLALLEPEVLRASAALATLESSEKRMAGGGRGFVNPPTAVKRVPFDPDLDYSPKGDKKKPPVPPSMMAYYEAALEEQRHFAAQSDALHGLSKEKELEFWRAIAADKATTAAEQIAIARKTSALEVAILTDKAKEIQALDGITVAGMRDTALARIDLDEQTAQTQAALGRTTQAQLLAQELQFEDARAAIKNAALAAQAARLDPDRDVVAIAQINAQIQALELAHQQKMANIRGQAQIQSAAQVNATWQDAGQRISGLWDKGVQAMMNGTFTWRNATKAVGAELGGWFAGVIKRQVADWIFGENAKTAATAMGTAARWAMETLAAAKSIALWAATAVKNIMTSAWEAMAGAWKAMVGIPYVGPFLAVAAAGAAFAGVAAIASHVSAAGGYDIPAGVNPMVQTHASEMILPATLASTVRDMATVYSQVRGGQGGGAGGELNVNLRGASAGDFFLVHKADLVKALKSARKDMAF